MKVSFENPDKINGLLTIVVEEDDYKEGVEKELKKIRAKSNMPGFRPGQVPMGLLRRQYGNTVKVDVINGLLGDEIGKYVQENHINMLGQPLGSEKQEAVDLEKPAPYTFMFDIAVAPEFDIKLSADDKVDYYDITVDDALIDQEVNGYAARFGQYKDVDSYSAGDTLEGDLRELDAEGKPLEGGISVEKATVVPNYIKDEEQKKLFEGTKTGDVITFSPTKAFDGAAYEVASLLKVDKDKVGEHTGDFSYQVTAIHHFENHAVDQDLFDQVFGKDAVKDEAAFRQRISDNLKATLATSSDWRFETDLRKYAEEKVGDLTFPDTLLKRMMKANNKDKDQKFIDENYEPSIKALKWDLIRDRLAVDNGVKVNDDDVRNVAREVARAQFAQYGMPNVPEDAVNNYADELLKKQETARQFAERAIDEKLTQVVKGVVTLNHKAISYEDFNKLGQEQ